MKERKTYFRTKAVKGGAGKWIPSADGDWQYVAIAGTRGKPVQWVAEVKAGKFALDGD